MTSVRVWLQHLSSLKEKVRRSFLSAFFRHPLNPRRAFILQEERRGPKSEETDEAISRPDFNIHLIASDEVRTDISYQAWTAPLAQLHSEATLESVKEAIAHLDGFKPTGQTFFPLEVYRDAIGAGLKDAQEWVHYGTASTQPALDLLLPLPAAQQADAATQKPVTFILHCSRQVTGEERKSLKVDRA